MQPKQIKTIFEPFMMINVLDDDSAARANYGWAKSSMRNRVWMTAREWRFGCMITQYTTSVDALARIHHKREKPRVAQMKKKKKKNELNVVRNAN